MLSSSYSQLLHVYMCQDSSYYVAVSRAKREEGKVRTIPIQVLTFTEWTAIPILLAMQYRTYVGICQCLMWVVWMSKDTASAAAGCLNAAIINQPKLVKQAEEDWMAAAKVDLVRDESRSTSYVVETMNPFYHGCQYIVRRQRHHCSQVTPENVKAVWLTRN